MGLDNDSHRAMKLLGRCGRLVPPEVLKNAIGICVVSEVKAGMVVSANVGKGLVIKRLGRNRWGFPSSVMCFGMGIGGQIGGEKIDLILIINNDKTMQAFQGSIQFRLGGELGVSAGPIGKDARGFGAVGSGGAVGELITFSIGIECSKVFGRLLTSTTHCD